LLIQVAFFTFSLPDNHRLADFKCLKCQRVNPSKIFARLVYCQQGRAIMDISSVISASTIQSGLYATNSTPSIASLLNTTATSALTSAVDISGLGQLLSASAIFESGLLKAAATNQANFSTVTAATQLFVQAFNNFVQSDTMQSSSAVSPAAVFMQVLNAQNSSASGASVISSLADLGITYLAATSVNGTGQMSVDYTALQSAFNADQQGTVAVLAQATKTVGQIASEFTSLLAQSDVLTKNAQSTVNSATLNGLLEAGVSSSTTNSSAAEVVGGGQSAAATQVAGVSVTITGAGAAASVAQAAGTVATTPASVVPTVAETAATTSDTAATAATTSAVAASATESTAASTAAASAAASTIALSTTASTASTVSTASAAAASESLAASVSEATTTTPVSTSMPLISAAVNEPFVASAAGVTVEGLAASPATTGQTGATVVLAESASGVAVLTGQSVASAVTEAVPVVTTVAASLTATPATTALANPTIDISNPAIAAAIAAYHMVDGLFDTAWPHDEGVTIATKGYTEIWPVGEIRAVRLDLYV
jgi:hypothetical protein